MNFEIPRRPGVERKKAFALFSRTEKRFYYFLEFIYGAVLDNFVFLILWIANFRSHSSILSCKGQDPQIYLTSMQEQVNAITPDNFILYKALTEAYKIFPANFRINGGLTEPIKKIFSIIHNTSRAEYKEKMNDFSAFKRGKYDLYEDGDKN